MKTIEERFASKYTVDPVTQCWLWKAAVNNKGYGVLGVGGRGKGSVYAHRFSWTMHNGPIPEGLYACHKCDTPRCVNPDHLFLGTHTENLQDAVRKNRMASGARSGAHTKPERRRLGEEHGNHILCEEHIHKIRLFSRSGRTNVSLAHQFGVSEATIRDIVHRRTWRHI
jgi:hypothetical protein